MKIQLLFFASACDLTGEPSLDLEVPESARVHEVLATLCTRFPALAPHLEVFRFAVNEDFVEEQHVLQADDVLALLPPVSGG